MISAINLNKQVQGEYLLRNINLTFPTSSINVVIGHSGAGKTTLLRNLALLEYPDSGELTVGSNVYNFPIVDKEALRKPWPELTVVFQQHFLWPHLTLRENILLPVKKKNSSYISDHLDYLIKSLNMEKFINSYPNEASIGQRQRAAIARAVIVEPKYLLMDEITSALDIEQVSAIRDFLLTLKQSGITLILTTHLIHFAKQIADQVVFMDKGEIIESGGYSIFHTPKTEILEHFLSHYLIGSDTIVNRINE